jgi:hypothetical protein
VRQAPGQEAIADCRRSVSVTPSFGFPDAIAIPAKRSKANPTMLKRAALALCVSAPVTGGLCADPDVSDVSTWRWNESVILRAQRDAEIDPAANVESLSAKLFGQGYERYGPTGIRDTASNGTLR